MTTRFTGAEKLHADDFQIPFTHKEGEIIYDAATKYGPWATMTQESFDRIGRGKLGLGCGQNIAATPRGSCSRWRADLWVMSIFQH